MQMYYITLNTHEEALAISKDLLEKRLAICANWFPIECAYRWEGELVQESEFVMIVKTQEGLRAKIEEVIAQHISYLNCIAEIKVDSLNDGYLKWLNAEVPQRQCLKPPG